MRICPHFNRGGGREMPRPIGLATPEKLAEELHRIRLERRKRKKLLRDHRPPRRSLSPHQRSRVLAKTAGRCHICGGEILGAWHADHVLAYSGGGDHSDQNYLAAHPVCNSRKWDFSAEEFQFILKVGVWARTQIEHGGELGRKVAAQFLRYERARERRRKT